MREAGRVRPTRSKSELAERLRELLQVLDADDALLRAGVEQRPVSLDEQADERRVDRADEEGLAIADLAADEEGARGSRRRIAAGSCARLRP